MICVNYCTPQSFLLNHWSNQQGKVANGKFIIFISLAPDSTGDSYIIYYSTRGIIGLSSPVHATHLHGAVWFFKAVMCPTGAVCTCWTHYCFEKPVGHITALVGHCIEKPNCSMFQDNESNFRSWPQGYKKSCSTQLSMNFFNCWHLNIYEQEK